LRYRVIPMNAIPKKSLTLLITAAIALLPGCTRMNTKGTYSSEQTSTGTVSEKIKSPDSIDRAITYEIYFRPEKPLRCMMIGLTAAYNDQGLSGKSKPLRIFFMVDRLIDVTRYGKTENRFVHTEMAKNYNNDWEQTKEITLCSRDNDPMMQIENNSRYRVRFTSFTSEKFDYILTFKSDVKITIWEP